VVEERLYGEYLDKEEQFSTR